MDRQEDAGNGALFKNDRKEKPTHPDYRGDCTLHGTKYWVSGWLKTSSKGTKFMSLAFREADQEQATAKPAATKSAPAEGKGFDKSVDFEIPFKSGVPMTNVLSALKAPFPVNAVSWRVGSTTADKSKGMALAFIDARDVMKRLDDVMGVDWQCEYVPMPNGTCCCRIGLVIDGHWRWRSNGAVNLTESDKVDAKEMAEKASYSDAFKRAAVLWGVGQYLYDVASPWSRSSRAVEAT